MTAVFKTVRYFLLSLLVFPLMAGASGLAPDALVRNVSEEVLTIVRNDPGIRSGDASRAVELVRAKVLPHFNFERMTQLAVGRYWRQATAAQKQQLVGGFQDLLVRTYSNALTIYRDETVEYKPTRMEGDSRAQVRTEIRKSGRAPVEIDYVLQRQSDGWKVFDVVVAGASLVMTYRDSFGQEVRDGGIDRLIESLAAKNRQLEAQDKRHQSKATQPS